MHKQQSALITKDGVSYLIPFILVTFCFALWGFANDITNPTVKAFSKIFRMNVTDVPHDLRYRPRLYCPSSALSPSPSMASGSTIKGKDKTRKI